MKTTRTGRQWKLLSAKGLKKAREAAHMSRKDLAEKLGMSQGAIQGWESGSGTPSEDTQRKICAVLNIQPNDQPQNGANLAPAQAPAQDRKKVVVGATGPEVDQRDYAVASIVAAMVHKGLLNSKEDVLQAIPKVAEAL